MSGMLRDAVGLLVDMLEPSGLPIVTDSKAIRPGVVVVDPPTIVVRNADWVDCTFGVTCLLAPPADGLAELRMLDMADAILKLVPTTTGTPTVYEVNGQQLPGYRLTVPLSVRR